MASFYGSADEVNRFLMPYIRNLVQYLTKSAKKRFGGVCEHCGRGDVTLEAAHVHGKDRKTIVAGVLEKYRAGEGFHIGNLDTFEREVIEAHEPIGETFLFLCRDCHLAYDAIEQPIKADERQTSMVEKEICLEQSGTSATACTARRYGKTLPIELIPANKREFNNAFLASGKAEIREIHEDGKVVVQPWRAQKYKPTSDPINNLRTKSRYRQGVWQELRIARLVVEVV